MYTYTYMYIYIHIDTSTTALINKDVCDFYVDFFTSHDLLVCGELVSSDQCDYVE
jgi:hypothetical protein